MQPVEEIKKRLKAKTIHDLRQIARAVGVSHPADGKKDRLIDCIMSIACGEADPAAPAVRGARPKSTEYDRQLVADILRCREVSLSDGESIDESQTQLEVGSGLDFDSLDFKAEGILEKCDGKWFMRINGRRENFITKAIVNDYFVRSYLLKEGDLVCGQCKRTSMEEAAGLAVLYTVNGVSPDSMLSRRNFEDLTPVYPEKRLYTAAGKDDVSGRLIDLLAPMAAGQRALIFGAHSTGKSSLLKKLAAGINANKSGVKLILLLIDCAPEQCADFRKTFSEADVFSSSFEAGAAAHVNTAMLALEYAKRQTESGRDTVLVLDDLTSLARAYSLCGRQVSAADPAAIDAAKRFLAAARNFEEGGSLTILSAVSTDGDVMENAVSSALKNVCNMRVTLSEEAAQLRIFPPVDIKRTFSNGDENLLSATEIQAESKLRALDLENIIKLVLQTEDNKSLCEQLLR